MCFLSNLYRIQDLQKTHFYPILALYVILLCLVVAKHEPWLDEAQAWLLATDFSLGELFVKYLRYEGHPALWYLILFIPAKLGLPYLTVNIIAAAAAIFAQWLFLKYSPFPLVIKILFPFSFFAFYQYAVVARSYCLVAPVLFLIAIRYKTRFEHPVIYSLLLCILANISVHTFLIAGILMFFQFSGVIKLRSSFGKREKLYQLGAACLFALSALQIILVLAPPADQGFALGNNWGWLNFYNVSQKMLGGSLIVDEAAPVTSIHHVFALAVLIASLIFLRQQKLMLTYLLPLFTLLGFFAVKYSNVWHEGILFFLWIFVLWIRFDSETNKVLSKTGKIVSALLTIVLIIQVYWAASAARYDYDHAYSGSYGAARYIKENHLENEKIYISGWKTVAIQPYFDKKIFYNLNQNSDLRIWLWSSRNQTPVGFNENIINSISSEQPEIVVIASDHLRRIPPETFAEYRLAAAIEENICWKGGIYEPDSYWIYRKTP